MELLERGQERKESDAVEEEVRKILERTEAWAEEWKQNKQFPYLEMAANLVGPRKQQFSLLRAFSFISLLDPKSSVLV